MDSKLTLHELVSEFAAKIINACKNHIKYADYNLQAEVDRIISEYTSKIEHREYNDSLD